MVINRGTLSPNLPGLKENRRQAFRIYTRRARGQSMLHRQTNWAREPAKHYSVYTDWGRAPGGRGHLRQTCTWVSHFEQNFNTTYTASRSNRSVTTPPPPLPPTPPPISLPISPPTEAPYLSPNTAELIKEQFLKSHKNGMMTYHGYW